MEDGLVEASRMLIPYFDDGSEALSQMTLTFEEVKAFLRHHISDLLDRNPQRLMSVLYRIDVAESDVHRTFETAAPDALIDELVELILHRQLQKIETRRKYR